MRLIVALLPHTSIEQLMEDRPFAVACVDRLDNDIFVVFHNWLTAEFNVLKLPQSYHEQFTIFFHAIGEHVVQDVYIENLAPPSMATPSSEPSAAGLTLYFDVRIKKHVRLNVPRRP